MAHIGYYLRSAGNLHYFAALRRYLDGLRAQGGHEHALVVRMRSAEGEGLPEYEGYRHLFSDRSDLDAFDLVLAPTYLRPDERGAATRAVMVFHGMSDKPFTYERDFRDYLLCLCAGRRQVDRLLEFEHNRRARWAIVGYPKFDDPPEAPALFDNGRPTLIYCPTWRKGGLSSLDLFLADPALARSLAQDHNLVLKPHPNVFNPDREFYDPRLVERLESLAQEPGIALLRSGNVMAWFAQCDLYLGDISASAYEWLYFDRPMVFLNPQPGRFAASADFRALTYAWQCGEVCDDLALLGRVVKSTLHEDGHRATREAVLSYSVAHARDGGAAERGLSHLRALLGG